MRPPRPLALSLGVLLLAPIAVASAHGGRYVGPAAPPRPPARSPGPARGPMLPPLPASLPAAPAGPGGAITPGPALISEATTEDETGWGQWWSMNQAPLLALKSHLHALDAYTGSEGWFLGHGQKPPEETLRPSEAQVRAEVVPALLAVLERGGRGNDLTTGALVALAKIGERPDGSDGARLEAAILRYLPHGNQEIRETAAIALGILASPRSIPTLAHLLWDTPTARKSVRANEVDYRTRSFAAYGLGLIGARPSTSEGDRRLVVSVLRRALESDDTRTADLEVACLVALGLVPLATLEAPAGAGDRRQPPESSRLAQLELVLGILRDERREDLLRAQCPIALARLLADLPEPYRSSQRERVAERLIELVERDEEDPRILQSCILALGAIGTNDGKDPLDRRIRRTLAEVARSHEAQARGFALMAAAELGARMGQESQSLGVDDVHDLVVRELARGKTATKPWAGLAGGVLCHRLTRQGMTHPAVESLRRVLRIVLEDEDSPLCVGAYALGAGFARSSESAPRLLKLLGKELQEDVRGQVALALGLLGEPDALAPLRKLVADSRYRPEVLRQAAIALGLLGDKDIGLQLAAMLADARSLATQAALASALGWVGDHRALAPLLALLSDENANERARAFAAVALGNVADKELLPWNAKIGSGLNYRAAPATLFDPGSGTGILDLF